MQHAFVTGAAGFIGSNLVDRLLADGVRVTGWDNLSTGQPRFLQGATAHPQFRLLRGDNLDLTALTAAMKGADFVFHLAANADIRDGWKHPAKDLQQNTVATFNVLEAMRANGVRSRSDVRGCCSVNEHGLVWVALARVDCSPCSGVNYNVWFCLTDRGDDSLFVCDVEAFVR